MLSAPTISISSSEARSARSSSVFTPFSPSATSIAGVSASIAATSSLTPSSMRFSCQFGVAAGQEGLGAADQFFRDALVEALDRGEFLERREGQFLDRS